LLHVELFVTAPGVLLPLPLPPHCCQAATTAAVTYVLIIAIIAVSIAVASAAFSGLSIVVCATVCNIWHCCFNTLVDFRGVIPLIYLYLFPHAWD
jgi:hypothetical protein